MPVSANDEQVLEEYFAALHWKQSDTIFTNAEVYAAAQGYGVQECTIPYIQEYWFIFFV